MSYFNAVVNQQNEHIKNFMQGSSCIVEATSFEAFTLWDKYTTNGRQMSQYGGGFGITVGYCKDSKDQKLSVTISLFKYSLDGKSILFYHPTSKMVDYGLIEDWINENMPVSARREDGTVKTTDCQNFHIVESF